jgi:jumonji domain-containing protein 7
MSEFLDALAAGSPASSSDRVLYLSHQNDSLRTQLPSLAAEIPTSLPIAEAAFGNAPDAINIWIGDDRSVTSVHKVRYL